VKKRKVTHACQELNPDSLVITALLSLPHFDLLFKVNEVEVEQSLGMQSGVMSALLVVGGLDSRPRIGGLIMAEGLGLGESW
jgi:hypothetical protein